MINGLYGNLDAHQATAQTNPQNGTHKVLRMVKNERMGGSVPMWETVRSPIETSLSNAQNVQTARAPDLALAYKSPGPESAGKHGEQEEFNFGDLLDMVNPLHHIPVIGHVYRELSGDEIKPIARIIGGGIFGGPLGAAGSLVNIVIEQETGKDLTANAMTFALKGEAPSYRDKAAATATPEIRLAALQSAPRENAQSLPGNLLTYVDMKVRPDEIIIERVSAAQGRTAGSVTKAAYPDLEKNPMPVREPITQVRLSPRYND